MTTPVSQERSRFADELISAGPDAPTLCEGWDARDLAAHVVLRERRPDAALGVVVPFLSGHTAKVQDRIAEGDWVALVDTLRSGPPVWSPTRIDKVDVLANTTEMFVHHEDVRRAADGWEPRRLDVGLAADLATSLRRSAKLFARRTQVGLVLEPGDGSEPIVARKPDDDGRSVTVRGPIGELVLFLVGRGEHARVEIDGTAEATAALAASSFGF